MDKQQENQEEKKNEKSHIKNKSIYDAFNNAITGIIYSFKTQRNVKIQYLIAVLILLLSLFVDIDKIEFLILCLTISLVIITELINTAIEKTVDLFTDIYHPIAKIAKDVAAGAVVIACVNSVIIGFFIFKDKLNLGSEILLDKVIKDHSYVAITVILLVFIGVIVLKAILNKGTPLEGGMPSGHTAIAFTILTLITIYTKSVYVFVLSLILALIIAHSRYKYEIHKLSEIIFGAFFGTIIVLLIYYLINLKGGVI